jgi:CheY-like chemotaxis protein
MQRQTAASVLIIEDEHVIAMDLARIVEEMGHHLCGTASREKEAIELAERTRPNLVLADIQLKDGDSGIQAVREILRRIDAPVIFVTGFPERLLTGEALEPAFVITKPFNPQTLKTAIAQALSLSH